MPEVKGVDASTIAGGERPSGIRLRGVRVHNLQSIDVDIPYGKLTVVCGPSGAGKSSLVMDTLHAEGQRRYIETFSVRARQFLSRLERPEADSLAGIPPAIAVSEDSLPDDPRTTLGQLTEVDPLLRLLFARHSEVRCFRCGRPVRRDAPQAVAEDLASFSAGARFLVTFAIADAGLDVSTIRAQGFHRFVAGGKSLDHSRPGTDETAIDPASTYVVVDRLSVTEGARPRILESLSLALRYGLGAATLFLDARERGVAAFRQGLAIQEIDGLPYARWPISQRFRCDVCGLEYVEPSLRLFNPRSPLGACPTCRGTGRVASASGHQGAGTDACPDCLGQRLRPEALSCRIDRLNIAELARHPIDQSREFLESAFATRQASRVVVNSVLARLSTLERLGLGHLTLDRTLETLSSGEALRAGLTAILSSSLVRVLYLLDEPTSRLHPHDSARIMVALLGLRDRGNTVVVATHDERILRAADHVIELGPGAGADGGQVTFAGTVEDLSATQGSPTGDFLGDRRPLLVSTEGKTRSRGEIQLRGACGGVLKHADVDIPLGAITVVTGASGSGKSTLVERTLYPALMNRLQSARVAGLPYDTLEIRGTLADVLFIDQTNSARSSRATPATYTKTWDPIRTVYAETSEAKIRGLTPRHFSFNVDGGRCDRCHAAGRVRVDMKFLPDVYIACPKCRGRRFTSAVLECRHRDRTITDVLDMTAREAFGFFRGKRNVQSKLQPLLTVGLDYLRLGQPLRTLSRGEWQRIKLASQLGIKQRRRALIILDGPSAGLHPKDLPRLWECLETLLTGGHTLLLVDENPLVVAAADHVIELDSGKVLTRG